MNNPKNTMPPWPTGWVAEALERPAAKKDNTKAKPKIHVPTTSEKWYNNNNHCFTAIIWVDLR